MSDETKKDEVVAEEATEETTAAPAEEAAATEAPAEEATPAAEEAAEVEVPAEFKEIVEKIESMSVLELNTLVKVFEEKFGVSATAVAVAGGAGGDAGGAEEKSDFAVELSSFGDSKIGVIKVVKEILGLGLKEAKELVEGAPAVLKEGVAKDEAEEWKTKLEEAGATVALK